MEPVIGWASIGRNGGIFCKMDHRCERDAWELEDRYEIFSTKEAAERVAWSSEHVVRVRISEI